MNIFGKEIHIRLKYLIILFSSILFLGLISFGYYIFTKENHISNKTDIDYNSKGLIQDFADETEGSGDVSETQTQTGEQEKLDEETISIIDKVKSKISKVTGGEAKVTVAPNNTIDTVKMVRSIEKQPYNIKGFYFGIAYGIGREGEWGTETTDSIKVFVYNQNTNKLVIISVPRDREINYMGEDMKIDFLYDHIKKQYKDQKTALKVMTDYISELLDIPLNYYILIDFTAFKEFVDEIGGLDICTTKPLYWEGKLMLQKGCYTLDGETVLKIARTRKQDNDFYRMMRQNNVIYSIMEKVKTLDLKRMMNIAKIYINRVDTNLNIPEIIYIFNNFMQIDKKVQVVMNNQCGTNGRPRAGNNFCFFKQGKEYKLTPYVSQDIIRHYIKTVILHPDIYGCEFDGKGSNVQKINLMNVGVKIKRFYQVKDEKFEITNLSGCTDTDIKSFINP